MSIVGATAAPYTATTSYATPGLSTYGGYGGISTMGSYPMGSYGGLSTGLSMPAMGSYVAWARTVRTDSLKTLFVPCTTKL